MKIFVQQITMIILHFPAKRSFTNHKVVDHLLSWFSSTCHHSMFWLSVTVLSRHTVVCLQGGRHSAPLQSLTEESDLEVTCFAQWLQLNLKLA